MPKLRDDMVAWIVPALGALEGQSPTDSAGFAVCARSPSKLTIRVKGTGVCVDVDLTEAARQAFGAYAWFAARAVVSGLSPDTTYEVELWDGGSPVDRCFARTWPQSLGTQTRPFELFLGSCYSVHTVSKGGNDLSPLIRGLRGKTRVPHLKILCGDQVYLDIPVAEVLPRERESLRALLARKYLEAWTPQREDARRTFGDLLRTGSTLFVTDDHEYWNNYPYFLSFGPSLWRRQQAEAYAEAAHQLVRTFQLVPPTLRTYRLGTPPHALSLALVDGRSARSAQRNAAHAKGDLRALAQFLARSEGPALVCLSQPLFDPSAGWLKRTFQDRGLADFADYGELVDALSACPHDVLVLSGDIHGGRVCSTFRRARPGRTRAQTLYEVVSSPLSLVKGGDYADSIPNHIYPEKGKGQQTGSYGPIQRHFGPLRANHGCLLRLWAYDKAVAFRAEFVATRTGTRLGPSQRSFRLA